MLLRNISSNWISLIITAGVSFFTMPFMVRHLGDATYGLWGVIVSLTGYMAIFDFGVRSSLNRFISRHHVTHDNREVNAVVSTGLVVYAGLGLAVLVTSVLLAHFFPRYFDVATAPRQSVQTAIVLTGAGLALTFPTAVFNSILTGLQRYDLLNGSSLLGFGLRTAIMLVSLTLGYGLPALALAAVIASLAELVVSYLCARHIYRELRFSLGFVTAPTITRLIQYSFYTFLVIIGVKIIVDSDYIIIGKFLGTAAVTAYIIASSLVNYSRSFVMGISAVLIPKISSHEARQDEDAIRQTLLEGTRYCLLVGLPILAVLIVAGREFINVWLGPGYRASYPVLVCLSVAWAFSFAESAASAALFGTSRHKIQGLLVIAEAGANLALSLVLVNLWGILGVAVGTLIPMAIKNTYIQVYACRAFRLSLWEYWRQSLLPPLLATLPLALLMLLAVRLYPPKSLVAFSVELGLALALTVVPFFWLGSNTGIHGQRSKGVPTETGMSAGGMRVKGRGSSMFAVDLPASDLSADWGPRGYACPTQGRCRAAASSDGCTTCP